MKRKIVAAAVLLGACSHPASTPAPEPRPDTVITAPPVVAAAPAVRAVAGTYRITTDIAPGNSGAHRNAPPPNRPGTLVLGTGVSGNADGMAAIGTQYAATASIPGYANPPAQGRGRGRRTTANTGTPTTWWPAAGDSVVVHIVGARGNRIQLRGRLRGSTISGEVWLMSLETGNTFQLGNFTATKVR